nr:MAG TPA: hypothetical protein [Caudoviricetes sp.]
MSNTIRANDGGELLNSDYFYYAEDEIGRKTLNIKDIPYSEKLSSTEELLLRHEPFDPDDNFKDENDSPVPCDLPLPDTYNFPMENRPDFENFEVGEKYKITFSGKHSSENVFTLAKEYTAFKITEDFFPEEYSYFFKYFENDIIIGEISNSDNSEEPNINLPNFFIAKYDKENVFYWHCLTEKDKSAFGNVNIDVRGMLPTYKIHKLKSKYLPEDVVLQSDIPPYGKTIDLSPGPGEYLCGQGYNSWGWELDKTFPKLYSRTETFYHNGKNYSAKDLIGLAAKIVYTGNNGEENTDFDTFRYDATLGVVIGNKAVFFNPTEADPQYFCRYNEDTNKWEFYLVNVANKTQGLALFGISVEEGSKIITKVTPPKDICLINSLITTNTNAAESILPELSGILKGNIPSQNIFNAELVLELMLRLLPSFTDQNEGYVLGIEAGKLAWVPKT